MWIRRSNTVWATVVFSIFPLWPKDSRTDAFGCCQQFSDQKEAKRFLMPVSQHHLTFGGQLTNTTKTSYGLFTTALYNSQIVIWPFMWCFIHTERVAESYKIKFSTKAKVQVCMNINSLGRILNIRLALKDLWERGSHSLEKSHWDIVNVT